jgi:hypothetical protein
VDALLRGFPLPPEIRTRDDDGKIKIEKAAPAVGSKLDAKETTKRIPPQRGRSAAAALESPIPAPARVVDESPAKPTMGTIGTKAIRIYPYGVARNRLQQSAKRFGVPAIIVKDADEADALVTLRAYYRDRQATIMDAEARGMPIYVLRANTIAQVDQFMSDLFNLPSEGVTARSSELDNVRDQTQAAIASVLNGERWVDLPPGPSLVRRLQHEMARTAELVSHSYGKEPRRHVRIFRE